MIQVNGGLWADGSIESGTCSRGVEKMQPAHMVCLQKEGRTIVTTEGQEVALWQLQVPKDQVLLSGWAKHFREHYCLDAEIDALRKGTGLSRQNYLLEILFPDRKSKLGPGVRAGDFTEILVSDYLEFTLGFWVPRNKYAEKSVRDESKKGLDVLGFNVLDPHKPNRNDSLFAIEVKGQLTGKKYAGKLQEAIDDSSKDYLKRAETLNAIKRRLRADKDWKQASVVERFQNEADRPYTYQSGAAAVLTDTVFDAAEIGNSSAANHNNSARLDLLVIRGQDLMDLVHALYERAADEA